MSTGRLALASVVLAVAAGVGVADAQPAPPSYAVAHTGGDGVWLHGTPGFQGDADLKAVLPEGTPIQVICYTVSDWVGNNPYWLRVTTSDGEGYITDAYSSTVWSSNNSLADQGFVECGSAAPAPTEPAPPVDSPTVLFFTGAGEAGHELALRDADLVVGESQYAPEVSCDPTVARSYPTTIGDEPVDTLVGYSLGRLPVLYALKANPDLARTVHHVVLYDPGAWGEMVCDRSVDAYQLLSNWLADPANHLTIFAGHATADKDSGFRHQGIQETYFQHDPFTPSAIRDRYSNRVFVCNVGSGATWAQHEEVLDDYGDAMDSAPITACPAPTVEWHP